MAATLSTLAALTAGDAATGADQPAKIAYHDSFTAALPGRPAGRTFTDTLTNPDDPNGKPPATAHVHTQLPAGARYDTGAVPACTASDAEIMASGPSACPVASKVGGNQLVVDSGLPGSGRYAHEDVTFFNEPGGLILVSHDQASGAYLVFHAKLQGGSFDFDQPMLPGTPPDGGATKTEHGTFLQLGSAARGYITTPSTCPATRIWRFRYEYTFRDGRKQVVTSDQRCQRRPAHRLRVALRGIPKRCASSAFPAGVRVAGGAVVRAVDVLLDGRRIATHARRRFTVRVAVPGLSAGGHTLAAKVRDSAGDTATRTASFKRC